MLQPLLELRRLRERGSTSVDPHGDARPALQLARRLCALCVAVVVSACGGEGDTAATLADTTGGADSSAATAYARIEDTKGCPSVAGPVGVEGGPPPTSMAKICTVEGDLWLTGTDQAPIDDAALAPLLNLRVIHGSLYLQGTVATSLQALARLERVDGDVAILDNHALVSLEGLASLVAVGHDLIVRNNAGLQRLATPLLATVTHGLVIEANVSLQSLGGLDKVSGVGEAARLVNNDSLLDCKGLEAFSDAGDSGLLIADNARMVSLEGLQALKTVGAALEIRNNRDLKKISGLQQLVTATVVRIHHNDALTQIDGFVKLQKTLQVEVFDNPKLLELQGFSALKTLSLVEVANNKTLATCKAFGGATEISKLSIHDNAGLSELRFQTLLRAGTLSLVRNHALGSLAAFFSTKYIDVVEICDNTLLPPVTVENFLKQLYKTPAVIDDCSK
jgi:hypothetical protein